MQVRFKRLSPSAVIPTKARPFDAAFDLVATRVYDDRHGNIVCDTELAVEIPAGHVGLIFPRSSISETNLSLANSVAVIDPNYRGRLILKFTQNVPSDFAISYEPGDRIGQLIILPLPSVEFLETDELTPSPDDRGTQGFGSSNS